MYSSSKEISMLGFRALVAKVDFVHPGLYPNGPWDLSLLSIMFASLIADAIDYKS